MSRRSQAFAQGQPAFSWKVERIEQDLYGKPTRFKCQCKNHPSISGFGDTEEEAIRAATRAMSTAVETTDMGLTAAHQEIPAAPAATASPIPDPPA